MSLWRMFTLQKYIFFVTIPRKIQNVCKKRWWSRCGVRGERESSMGKVCPNAWQQEEKKRPVRMKIPLVLIRSKYQRKLPLARELFFSRFARNWANLFKSFKSFSYLYDLYRFVRFDFVDRWFCPLGHSFFSHHIATYREHHFQSYQVEKIRGY